LALTGNEAAEAIVTRAAAAVATATR